MHKTIFIVAQKYNIKEKKYIIFINKNLYQFYSIYFQHTES